MKLFEAHGGTNEAATKKAITMIITKNVGRYILAQREVNQRLSQGDFSKKCKPKKKCSLCQIAEILKDMADFEGVTKEACKTYKMLFNEDFDLKVVIDAMKKEFYDIENNKKKKRDVGTIVHKGVIMPEDAPDEVKKMCGIIQKAMDEAGMDGAQMEVVNMSGNNFGLRPEDYDSFGDFAKAISNARIAEEAIENGDKTAEEVIADAVIQKTEEEFVKTPSMKVRKGDLN